MDRINLAKDNVVMPARLIPGFRTLYAKECNLENNILLLNYGGLGDQVCAEPTLRYALEKFSKHGAKFSLATHYPSLFKHLAFENILELDKDKIVYDDFYVLSTIPQRGDLAQQFISHTVTNCVDAPTLYAFRSTLPIAYKEIQIYTDAVELPWDLSVVVHPGRHWPTKTFPKKWWDDVLTYLKGMGLKPVVVGKDIDHDIGTVDVNTEGCIDLRNKLDLNTYAHLLKNAKVILTNDSSPIHLGAAGEAFIGFMATCKHHDYITHWRKGQWSWRMKNFSRGGIWDILDHLPNKTQEINVDKCTPKELESWLCDPMEIAEWAVLSTTAYDRWAQ